MYGAFKKVRNFLNKSVIFFLVTMLFIIGQSCSGGKRTVLKKAVRNIDVPPGGTVVFDLQAHIYDDGELAHHLESTRFVYFTDNGDMQFEDLDYTEIDGEDTIMACQSKKVSYVEQKKTAYLSDAILEDYSKGVDVKSENLTVDFDSGVLYGKEVEVLSDKQTIRGDYFKYDLLEKNVEINSNVRGFYKKELEKK